MPSSVASAASSGDGLYVRFHSSSKPRKEGPLTRRAFEKMILLNRDLIDAGSVSAWKQSCGQAFKVDVHSTFSRRRLLSCDALGQLMELLMVVTMLAGTVWAISIVDWSRERAGKDIKWLDERLGASKKKSAHLANAKDSWTAE